MSKFDALRFAALPENKIHFPFANLSKAVSAVFSSFRALFFCSLASSSFSTKKPFSLGYLVSIAVLRSGVSVRSIFSGRSESALGAGFGASGVGVGAGTGAALGVADAAVGAGLSSSQPRTKKRAAQADSAHRVVVFIFRMTTRLDP